MLSRNGISPKNHAKSVLKDVNEVTKKMFICLYASSVKWHKKLAIERKVAKKLAI